MKITFFFSWFEEHLNNVKTIFPL